MKHRPRDLSLYPGAKEQAYSSFEEYLGTNVQSGITRITSNGMHLDFFYEDRGANVTFVYFHAALGLKQTYPFFGGRRMIGDIPVNYLGIADPVAGLTNAPTAGWHLGTREMPLHEDLIAVISHVLATGSGEHLIFFGASAGGFASLYYGSFFKSSLCLVVNPRTGLLNTPHTFDEYRDIAYPGISTEIVSSVLPTDLAAYYTSNSPNTVAYMQNLQDRRFLNNQLVPFLERCPGNSSIYLKLGEYGVGHVMPPTALLTETIRSAVSAAPEWQNALLDDGFLQGPSSNGLARASRTSIKAASSPAHQQEEAAEAMQSDLPSSLWTSLRSLWNR